MNRNYLLGVLVAIAACACATAQNPSTANSHSASKTLDKSVAAAAEHCVKDTGSYIKRPAGECSNQPGTSYSQQEIQDTGRISTAEALRELDPRIQ